MQTPWIHRIAVLLALATLVIILAGSLVTTNATLTQPAEGLRFLSTGHLHGALGLGAMALGFLIWVSLRNKRLAALGWTLCAAIVVESLLGDSALLPAPPRLLAAAHATLGHALAAGMIALALVTMPFWERDPDYVRDYGWPSMRSLAILVPLLVWLQVALGAAFRQQMIGVIAHILGALVVSMLILIMAAFVLHQFPDHRALRLGARTFMAITFTQVFLGIAAFTVRSLPTQQSGAILIIASAHVLTGALTLAASVVMGALIRHFVQPKQ